MFGYIDPRSCGITRWERIVPVDTNLVHRPIAQTAVPLTQAEAPAQSVPNGDIEVAIVTANPLHAADAFEFETADLPAVSAQPVPQTFSSPFEVLCPYRYEGHLAAGTLFGIASGVVTGVVSYGAMGCFGAHCPSGSLENSVSYGFLVGLGIVALVATGVMCRAYLDRRTQAAH